MGRGIVHPVDDFRASNPPTNEPLLDALAKDFVAHGYDLKHLIRTIMRSHVYQLSSVPERAQRRATRETSPAATAAARRPRCCSTRVSRRDRRPRDRSRASPAGSRAVQRRGTTGSTPTSSTPSAAPTPAPTRPASATRDGSVVQALHLMNSTTLTAKIANPTGRAAAAGQVATSTPEQIVEELYLAAYSRYPHARRRREVAAGRLRRRRRHAARPPPKTCCGP